MSTRATLRVLALFGLIAPALPAAQPAARSLYLKERVSISTDSGLIGLDPGTKVTRVSATSAGVKVKAPGGQILDVKPSQVTDDAVLGQRIASEFEAAKLQAGRDAAAVATPDPAATYTAPIVTPRRADPTPAFAAPTTANLGGSSLSQPAEKVSGGVKPFRFKTPKKKKR